ncbi:viroplasmin family protein [Staphylococcus pettenkoferi]|uniref:ribonuclease H1 domain-containing protein n=1 Tax=Staphylococcus pettenkoferi TaxID=170573 RepID=UPI002273B643|nr:viroplasmin family protein [Staphylococcus pettenkoferi]MCY1598008.1 viroplasmin family protein [Staphylococcus pettenkoferi]
MKFYAVKVGREPGVYTSWDEVKEQTNGFKGAIFKAFKTEEQARVFIENDENKQKAVESENNIDEKIRTLDNQSAILVTDGSYDKELKRYGYGLILIKSDIEDRFYNSGNNEKFVESRNVSGEVFAVLEGLRICKANHLNKVTIYYDYEGLEKWAEGEWKVKSEISKHYIKELENYKELNIDFVKVKAHSGHEYNEQADALAKLALDKKGSKTYDDGTVYISGITNKAIVNVINKMKEKYTNDFNVITKEEEYRKTYTLSNSINRVIISYYSRNLALYIQGKSSELFSNIIELLIKESGDLKEVNKLLNNVYDSNIKVDSVEETMKKVIPNYKASNENIDKIIYSAIYNLKVDCIKLDYSDLVHPTFRIQEYMLHKILNGKMNIQTDNNGKNQFGFFGYDEQNGLYYCNKTNELQYLTEVERNLLDDIYNFYRTNRHSFSHVSLLDMDTQIIEDIDTARLLILEGQKLFDRYCELNQ